MASIARLSLPAPSRARRTAASDGRCLLLFFITFLVATNLATALVLLGFFPRDWLRIINGLGRSLRDRGVAADARITARLTWRSAVGRGTAQAIALIPGFSRSGASMGGGLVAGLSNEDAARYGFLLATSIIGAAAALKLPDLFGHAGDGLRGPALVGALCSALTAYIAVRFLMRFFATNRLTPFAGYCLAAGVAASSYFAIQSRREHRPGSATPKRLRCPPDSAADA